MSLDELSTTLLPVLREALGASQTLAFGFDANGRPVAIGGTLTLDVPAYAQELFANDPLQQRLPLLDPQQRTVLLSETVETRLFHNSAAYCDFYRPRDAEDLLGFWPTGLPYGSPDMVGMLFTRAATDPPFAWEECQLLHACFAPISALTRRHKLWRQERRQRQILEALLAATTSQPTWAIDARGQVYWTSPQTRRSPQDLLSAASYALLCATASKVLRQEQPAPQILAVQLGDGAHGLLEISLAVTPSLCAVARVTLSCGAKTDSRIAAVARQYNLTRTETRALELVAAGKANNEIAEDMHVSLATVKTHVRRILNKTGTASRTQAALLAHALVLPASGL